MRRRELSDHGVNLLTPVRSLNLLHCEVRTFTRLPAEVAQKLFPDKIDRPHVKTARQFLLNLLVGQVFQQFQRRDSALKDEQGWLVVVLSRPTIARLPLEVFVGVLVDHLQLLLPAIDRGIRLTADLLLLHGAAPVSVGDTIPFREGCPDWGFSSDDESGSL